jgi:hypothetical protein
VSWGELPGQLERFAALLRRESETRPTAEFIVTQAGRFTAEWHSSRRVSADRMPLPLPRNQGLHPVGCTLQECSLNFRFEVAQDGEPTRAEFQVVTEGLLDVDEALIELQDHWRIDSEPADRPAEGREPHPSFHFQRGGRLQDDFCAQPGFVPSRGTPLGSGDWRCLMQYPGPRIASLPFDPILAIDFCVAQNDGPLWKRLRNVPEYYTIIEEAQTRLWKPFLEGLSDRAARQRWLGPLAAV